MNETQYNLVFDYGCGLYRFLPIRFFFSWPLLELYKVTYGWYGVIGIGASVIINIIVSIVTCGCKKGEMSGNLTESFCPLTTNDYQNSHHLHTRVLTTNLYTTTTFQKQQTHLPLTRPYIPQIPPLPVGGINHPKYINVWINHTIHVCNCRANQANPCFDDVLMR